MRRAVSRLRTCVALAAALAAMLAASGAARAWTLELGFAPRDNIIPSTPDPEYRETTLAVISSDVEIAGLEKSDILVENGTALGWRRRNAKLYDLQIRCDNVPGAVRVTVPAGCCTNADGEPLAGDVVAELPIAWAPWATDIRRSHFIVRGRWAPTASLLLSAPGDPVVAMEFIWISPGTWWMGSKDEAPSHQPNETWHKVTLTKGYWIATTECTQAQWEAVMGSNPSVFVRSGEEAALYPVDSVSWNDAMAFATALNTRYPGLGMGLPTEAQWEYACRAQTTTVFYSGPDDIAGDANSKKLSVIGWFAGNSANWQNGKEDETPPPNAADLSAEFTNFLYGPPEFTLFAPHRVGNHAKNDWGVKDPSGNVAEWCADVYAEDLGSGDAVDPLTGGDGGLRVVRGGSWRSPARDCRSCARLGLAPETSRDDIGFRPVIPGDAMSSQAP
jgi:formylglycine-generating enzyme required for sulfatase activity